MEIVEKWQIEKRKRNDKKKIKNNIIYYNKNSFKLTSFNILFFLLK